jgi:AmmeMemoRadiSam system protein B
MVQRFCEALRATIAESPHPVCVICSADLAHVGWRYGDPVHLTTPDLDRLESDDRTMLDAICSGSGEGFLDNLMRENNRRRICGFPCIYTMLSALDLKNGELLRYAQSAMDERNSTVSYASAAFYDLKDQ